MKMSNIQKNTSKGYTLLFAMLVSSLVLAIGISILSISKKEFLISTSTRDSTSALWAADGGVECAIYGDENGAFTTTADNTNKLGCSVPYAFPAGQTQLSTPTSEEGIFVFHARFGSSGTSCAVVTVTKYKDSNNKLKFNVLSRGYNTGWRIPDANFPNIGYCDVPSAKRVERALNYTAY
jgi:hypothetical protein